MPEPGVFTPLPHLWQIHREHEATVTPFLLIFGVVYVSGLKTLPLFKFNTNLTCNIPGVNISYE
jgi:hypothetical protein